jgi:predicted Fe-Mo cluster-binding NifX family protein
MVKKAVNSMTMKIAFCIKDNTQPAMLDDRFGRCNYFFIADSSGEILEKIKNPYKEDSQGAGIASAKLLDDHGVKSIVAPHLGPKALEICRAVGMELFDQGEVSSLEEIWPIWKEKQLKKVDLQPPKSGLRRG